MKEQQTRNGDRGNAMSRFAIPYKGIALIREFSANPFSQNLWQGRFLSQAL
jgi:hypothetical protein